MCLFVSDEEGESPESGLDRKRGRVRQVKYIFIVSQWKDLQCDVANDNRCSCFAQKSAYKAFINMVHVGGTRAGCMPGFRF